MYLISTRYYFFYVNISQIQTNYDSEILKNFLMNYKNFLLVFFNSTFSESFEVHYFSIYGIINTGVYSDQI